MNKIIVLNGWAASRDAWSLCSFMKNSNVDFFSYIQQLDGEAEDCLVATEGAILVGWSMGASMALSLAIKHPGKIRGLILLAPTPRMMQDVATNWIGMTPRRLKAFEMGLKITHGAGFFGVPDGLPNPYQMDTDENLKRGLNYLRDTDLREGLEKTFIASTKPKFPVAIFHSRDDGIVRVENVAYLKENIFPDAIVEIIDGNEHALPIFIPQKIDSIMKIVI